MRGYGRPGSRAGPARRAARQCSARRAATARTLRVWANSRSDCERRSRDPARSAAQSSRSELRYRRVSV